MLRIENSDELSVTALLAAKESDSVVRRTFTATAANLPKIAGAKFEYVPRPPDLAIPRMTQAGALEALTKRADEFLAQDRLSGAMLIARQGKTIFEKTWGLANRRTHAPVTVNTKFRLGSANKMFTAVAVLQLIDQRKLSLDGTVGDYMPDYPNKEIASKVTIRELLTHTGGTGDIFGPE